MLVITTPNIRKIKLLKSKKKDKKLKKIRNFIVPIPILIYSGNTTFVKSAHLIVFSRCQNGVRSIWKLEIS